ncbi:MAG: hypothetical protein ABIG68_01470 [Acidobacteriota bacterium]
MKTLLTLIVMLLLAAGVQAGDPLKIDEHDGIPPSTIRFDIPGTIDTSDPTWHRWRGVDYYQVSLDCNLTMTYEYASDPYYDAYCVQVSNTDPIQIWTAPIAGQFDTVLYLYCDAFDPANSTQNCITVDDDNGDGLLSFIGLVTTVTLQPGENYWLVICGYSPNSLGNYLIQTSDNVALCSVPVEELGWGALKNLFR